MIKGTDKSTTMRFAAESMKRRPDQVPLEKIVYLDEDLHTYKYFMTGQFDEEQRKKEIMLQQAEAQKAANLSDISSADRSNSREKEPEPVVKTEGQTAFFHKLQALNDKIAVFKNQFYER